MVDYRIFDRDKFTIVGTPTITDDGIASGFDGNNRINCTFNYNGNTFEINAGFYFKTDTDGANIFQIRNANNQSVLRCYLAPNNNIRIYATNNDNATSSSSYNPSEGDLILIKATINPDKTVAYTVTNANKNISVPVNEGTLTNDLTELNNVLYIGNANGNEWYIGSIDLKQFSITVDGIEVFNGSHKGTITDKLIYLNDTKQIIKSAIEAKGVEVSTETPFRQYADKIGEISSQKKFTSANCITLSPYSKVDYDTGLLYHLSRSYGVLEEYKSTESIKMNEDWVFETEFFISRASYGQRGDTIVSLNDIPIIVLWDNNLAYDNNWGERTNVYYLNYETVKINIKIVYTTNNGADIIYTVNDNSPQTVHDSTDRRYGDYSCNVFLFPEGQGGTHSASGVINLAKTRFTQGSKVWEAIS